jgi:hypothetical protein
MLLLCFYMYEWKGGGSKGNDRNTYCTLLILSVGLAGVGQGCGSVRHFTLKFIHFY